MLALSLAFVVLCIVLLKASMAWQRDLAYQAFTLLLLVTLLLEFGSGIAWWLLRAYGTITGLI